MWYRGQLSSWTPRHKLCISSCALGLRTYHLLRWLDVHVDHVGEMLRKYIYIYIWYSKTCKIRIWAVTLDVHCSTTARVFTSSNLAVTRTPSPPYPYDQDSRMRLARQKWWPDQTAGWSLVQIVELFGNFVRSFIINNNTKRKEKGNRMIHVTPPIS